MKVFKIIPRTLVLLATLGYEVCFIKGIIDGQHWGFIAVAFVFFAAGLWGYLFIPKDMW